MRRARGERGGEGRGEGGRVERTDRRRERGKGCLLLNGGLVTPLPLGEVNCLISVMCLFAQLILLIVHLYTISFTFLHIFYYKMLTYLHCTFQDLLP